MDSKKATPFQGVPTAPAVDRIREALPDLKPGDVVEYATLEALVMETRKTNRFKTVVQSWRRALEREHNLMTECIANYGYMVLDSPGRIVTATRDYNNAQRRVLLSSVRAKETDPEELPDKLRATREHLILAGASLSLSRKVQPKRIQIPKQ